MLKFILKKLFYGSLVLFGVTVVVFFIFHALPGDPVDVLCGQNCTEESREEIRKELKLDQPLYVQFGHYINNLSPIGIHDNTEEAKKELGYVSIFSLGDKSTLAIKFPYFGRSTIEKTKASKLLFSHLWGTIILAIAAMFIATVLGIILGIIAALNKGSILDSTILSTSVFGISTPSYVSSIFMVMVFTYWLADYTGLETGYIIDIDSSTGEERFYLSRLILPAITLGVRPLAIMIQLTRSSMLDVISQDYIRTAKAKGLSNRSIIYKHALKNALNPLISTITNSLASLMAGALFVETIFHWKGIGYLTFKAVNDHDLPVIIGSTLIIGVIFIILNIISDIMYAIVDPRVKLS